MIYYNWINLFIVHTEQGIEKAITPIDVVRFYSRNSLENY